jgi:hypothetical protein
VVSGGAKLKSCKVSGLGDIYVVIRGSTIIYVYGLIHAFAYFPNCVDYVWIEPGCVFCVGENLSNARRLRGYLSSTHTTIDIAAAFKN